MADAPVPTPHEHPLKPLVEQWCHKLTDAAKIKHERFGRWAEEAMKFFDGDHDFMWKEEYAAGRGGFLSKESAGSEGFPMFRMSINKAFDAVALFGPALYHQNPNIQVTPHKQPEIGIEALLMQHEQQTPGVTAMVMQRINSLPPEQWGQMEQAIVGEYQQMIGNRDTEAAVRASIASIFQVLLNWIQQEGNKKVHVRQQIVEAIVKGMGFLETKMFTPSGSERQFPRTEFLSVDDVLVDPDAVYWKDVTWMSIERCGPVNEVAAKYELPEDWVRGQYESAYSQGNTYGHKPETTARKKKGKTHDLIQYHEIYSKNGFGDHLKDANGLPYRRRYNFDFLGNNCHLVISKQMPFPLNTPTWILEDEEEWFRRAQWPIPFWLETDGWPAKPLTFYSKPKCVWPVGLFKPCIGEMRFVNWCMSFLADKVAASSQSILLLAKEASLEIQNQIKTSEAPYTVVDISEITGRKLNELAAWLEAPSFSQDVWVMVKEVLELIDKKTGLSEILYGLTNRQVRTATEADYKQENVSIRPDDMASQVEDCLSAVAVMEIQAARWMMLAPDVLPIIGPHATKIWQFGILTQEVDEVVRDYDFRIEAGTARKPNKAVKVEQLREFGQYALPVFQELLGAGITNPLRAYLQDIAKAMDLPDPDRYDFELPPPQETVDPEAEAKAAEAEMKLQEKQMEMEFKEDAHEQQLEHDEEAHDLELEQAREKAGVELGILRRRASLAAVLGNGSRT